MWIRSQLKEKLVKVDNVWIHTTYDQDYFEILTTRIDGGTFTLGVYSTKEKALKILDFLEQRLMIFSKKLDDTLVCDMPQENEVE